MRLEREKQRMRQGMVEFVFAETCQGQCLGLSCGAGAQPRDGEGLHGWVKSDGELAAPIRAVEEVASLGTHEPTNGFGERFGVQRLEWSDGDRWVAAKLFADRLAMGVEVQDWDASINGPVDLLANTSADTVTCKHDEHVAVGLYEAPVRGVDQAGCGVTGEPGRTLQRGDMDSEVLYFGIGLETKITKSRLNQLCPGANQLSVLLGEVAEWARDINERNVGRWRPFWDAHVQCELFTHRALPQAGKAPSV